MLKVISFASKVTDYRRNERKKQGKLSQSAACATRAADAARRIHSSKKSTRKSIYGYFFGRLILNLLAFSIGCGERGIRTPGASQHGSFQDCCNRPLYHLSLILKYLLQPLTNGLLSGCKYKTFCGNEQARGGIFMIRNIERLILVTCFYCILRSPCLHKQSACLHIGDRRSLSTKNSSITST